MRRIVWAVVLGGVVAASLVGGHGCRVRDSAPAPERIVLVTLDTTRTDRLGVYGSDAGLTPNIDAFAREATIFDDAVSPVPTTLASHSTIMTGLYPPDHKVIYNIFYKLGSSHTTVAEILQGAGYATAAFPASRIVARRFGLDQGFDHWVEPPLNERTASREHPISEHRSAEDGVDQAIAWMRENAADRQFIWLHLYDPHWPYDPPFPYSSRFEASPYDGEIAYTDAQLGRLLKFLQGDGRWDRTAVIMTADHGEGLYEHNEEFHSLLVYETTQSVPLIVKTPAGRAGRIAEPVSLADIAPTILDLASVPHDAPMRGISLRSAVLNGEEPPRRDLYFQTMTGSLLYGWAELEGVRYGDWKLVDSLSPELYNVRDDPQESDNLFSLEQDRAEEMRESVKRLKLPITEFEDAELEQAVDTTSFEGLGYVAGATGSSGGIDAPQPRELVYLQSDVIAAQAASARGDWETVASATEYILERDPANRWALESGTTAQLRLNRLDKALETAQQLRSRWPDWEDSYKVLAQVHGRRSEFAEALTVVRDGQARLAGEKPSPALDYLEIVASFDSGVDRARVCGSMIPAAIERTESSYALRLMEARCALEQGRLDAAVSALEAAVEHGFRRISALASTPEFARLAGHPGLQKLVLAERGGAQDRESE